MCPVSRLLLRVACHKELSAGLYLLASPFDKRATSHKLLNLPRLQILLNCELERTLFLSWRCCED